MISSIRLLDIRHLKLFCVIVSIRVFVLCIVQSYFVADEYWQSTEIAHRTAFGYGYVTWEWDKAIRSFFYPFWFYLIYAVLGILKLDYVDYLIFAPRILQSLLSSVADLYFWRWLNTSQLKLKPLQAQWIYLMWMSCSFVNYCSSRTLSNTAELDFTIIAMYYFPWNIKQSGDKPHFLWFVGLACLVRPTAAILWTPLCIYDVLTNPKTVKYFFTTYVSIVFKILCFSILIDLLFYRRFVLSPLNFILYNGQYNIGIHYGVHSWIWYIIIGIPVVLGPVFIYFYYSFIKISVCVFLRIYKKYVKPNEIRCKNVNDIEILMLFTVVWTVFWYSMIPHKEFRFILPLTPAMMYLAGANIDFNDSNLQNNFWKRYAFRIISTLIVIFNVLVVFYLGAVHQVGPLKVVSVLSEIAQENPNESNFLFLTPCHATPLYSHIHVNVSIRFLTCEPNLLSVELYKDESDVFFENPLHWLNNYVSGMHHCSLPSHIIIFSNLHSTLVTFLNHFNYTLIGVIFHSYFPQDGQSKYMEIFKLIRTQHC